MIAAFKRWWKKLTCEHTYVIKEDIDDNGFDDEYDYECVKCGKEI